MGSHSSIGFYLASEHPFLRASPLLVHSLPVITFQSKVTKRASINYVRRDGEGGCRSKCVRSKGGCVNLVLHFDQKRVLNGWPLSENFDARNLFG